MCIMVFDRSDPVNEDCSIIDYRVQVQLRVCLSDPASAEMSDAFPLHFSVLVNGTPCPLQVTMCFH